MQVRHNEDKLNMALSGTVRWAVDARVCDEPHTKANLLFQAHFSRLPLPIADYVTDARLVLDNALRLLQAMVDVAVDQGWASNAIATIRIMQVRRSRGLLLAAKSYDRKTPMHTSSEVFELKFGTCWRFRAVCQHLPVAKLVRCHGSHVWKTRRPSRERGGPTTFES